jgi:hypothetical protein
VHAAGTAGIIETDELYPASQTASDVCTAYEY